MGIPHSRRRYVPGLNRSNRLSDYDDDGDQKAPLLDVKKPPLSPLPRQFLLEDNRPPNHPPPSEDHRLPDRIVISQLKLRVSILEFLLKKQGIDLEEMKLHKSATDQKFSELTSRIENIASRNLQIKPPPSSSSSSSSTLVVPDLIDMGDIKDDHNCHSLPPFDSLFVQTVAKSNNYNPPHSVHREIDWNLHVMQFGYLLLVLLLSLSVGFLL
ncbi:hypothetical protein LINGRAHAP2_LOCUS14812 [Linum grandiflorum]